MSGTREGGLKAKMRNLERDPEFYSNIGRKGGLVSCNGGFASNKIGDDGLTGPERARKVGQIGGRRSKRGPAKSKE